MFKKIWNLIKRHKLLTIICSLAITLIIIMTVVFFSFFVGGNNEYGNRLKGIEKVELTKKDKTELITSIEENEVVSSASVRTQGKIIYINIKYKAGTKLDKAKEVANSSLKSIDEDQLKFYDVGYFLTSEDEESFYVTGTKNAKLEKISWIKSQVVVKYYEK